MKIILKILRPSAICLLLTVIFYTQNIYSEETYTNPVLVETMNLKSEEGFTNPVFGLLGIGDPAVIFHEGRYYLYPTGDQHSYNVYISTDLINWSKGPKVFKSIESGAWAPDVFYNPDDKKFYLYYTVNRKIGVAVSDRPDGMFTDKRILIKGAIDAHMFKDEDGKYYLYYVEYPAFRIFVQSMQNPTQKQGKPVQIIRPDTPWEKKHAAITEAPWMLKHKETYYLIYSGGGADTQDYAIGYATSKSPTGPFIKYAGNPIIKKGQGVFGPGHASVTKDRNGKMWMVYHQQKDKSKGWDRIICIDPVSFDEKGVLIGNPTRSTLQPAPATPFIEVQPPRY